MLTKYVVAFVLGLLAFWPLSFLDPCRLSFCIGVAVALLVVVITVNLIRVSGSHTRTVVQDTMDGQKRRVECLPALLVAGTSCILLATAYSIVFPPHLKYLELVDAYVWETASPTFLSGSAPLVLFFFVFGCAISLLSFCFISTSSRNKLEESHYFGRVSRDFGWIIATIGTFLVISTAVFNPLVFFAISSPPYPNGIWLFPYLIHGIVLVSVSMLFLATSVILEGWTVIFGNKRGFWNFVAAEALLVFWLLSSWLSNFDAFSYLIFLPHVFAYSAVFLAIQAEWSLLIPRSKPSI